jgi:hypothetical protein
MPLLGLLLIFVIGVCVLALNRKYYKYLISQFVVIITLAFVYGFIIAYIFTVQYSVLVSSMDGLERYMGSMAIMIILWLLSLMYAANDYWQNGRKQIICICLVSSLIIRCYPVYGETMFNIYNPTTISFKEWIRPDAESEANKLAMFTEEESRILFINQKDKDNKFGAGSEYWIEYYMVPRELGSALSSFNTDEDEAYKDFLTQYCTVDQLKTMISRSDYVYVLFTNQDFETMYGELFPVNSLKNGTLFKVNKEILVPIDTKEE